MTNENAYAYGVVYGYLDTKYALEMQPHAVNDAAVRPIAGFATIHAAAVRKTADVLRDATLRELVDKIDPTPDSGLLTIEKQGCWIQGYYAGRKAAGE